MLLMNKLCLHSCLNNLKMMFNFRKIIIQKRSTQSTQILYGLIGMVYGAIKIVEYYPDQIKSSIINEYNAYLTDAKNNKIEKIKNELLDLEKIIEISDKKMNDYDNYSMLRYMLSLGTIWFEFAANEIAKNNFDEKKQLVEMLNSKKYIQTTKIEKPLFLIDNNKFTTNIVLSSVFYGTTFAAAGSIPIVSFFGLLSYGIYHKLKKNKVDVNDK